MKTQVRLSAVILVLSISVNFQANSGDAAAEPTTAAEPADVAPAEHSNQASEKNVPHSSSEPAAKTELGITNGASDWSDINGLLGEDAHPATSPEAPAANADAGSSTTAQATTPTQTSSSSELSTIPVPTAPITRSPPKSERAQSARIEEVVVTANYREQGVQDVVGTTQAFNGGDLDKAGAGGMQDYLQQVPSVSIQSSGNGKVNLAMRGVSNINGSDLGFNGGSPTVGVYLNDVAIQGSGVFPDLKIFDLDRIEVLKGPQGTLYGEGAMGGAIKMMTKPVDFDHWQFRTEGAYLTTAGGDPGHEFRGAVNVPMIDDTLGARLVGTTRHDGGFVDYTTRGQPDGNTVNADSFRGILSYKPFDELKLDYMFLYNKEARKGFPVVDKGKQDEMTNSSPEDQYANTKFTIHSLSVTADLSFASLMSVSALYDTYRESQRRAPLLQALVQSQYASLHLGDAPNIFSNAPSYFTTDLHSFSQEFRLVSKGDNDVDWIAGAFYRDRNQKFKLLEYENTLPDPDLVHQLFGALNISGFNLLDNLQEDSRGIEASKQTSAYGEVTWHVIPDTLELTGGLRYFREVFDYTNDTYYYGIIGLLIATDPSNINNGVAYNKLYSKIAANGFLPKLSLGWHLTPDQMLYTTITRGYRAPTPNVQAAFHNGPAIVKPDYVWSTEAGYKGSLLDGSLITNWAIFDIEWQDIQGTLVGQADLGSVPLPFPYLGNAGHARIMGVEESTTWQPIDFMRLTLNLGYNYALLTKPGDTSTAAPNSILPNSPRVTGSSTIAFFAPLFDDYIGEVTMTYSYVDKQNTTFTAITKDSSGNDTSVTGTPVPAYSLLKGSLAVNHGAFRAQLFGDNLANKHAIISVSQPIDQYTIIAPRTIGIRLSYDF